MAVDSNSFSDEMKDYLLPYGFQILPLILNIKTVKPIRLPVFGRERNESVKCKLEPSLFLKS